VPIGKDFLCGGDAYGGGGGFGLLASREDCSVAVPLVRKLRAAGCWLVIGPEEFNVLWRGLDRSRRGYLVSFNLSAGERAEIYNHSRALIKKHRKKAGHEEGFETKGQEPDRLPSAPI
jgi:hypothetical protein